MTLSFTLEEKQLEQLRGWKANLPKPPSNAIGGSFTYSFTPTQLGIVVKVQYWDGQEIDISNYEHW
jgi:hypothetical protein